MSNTIEVKGNLGGDAELKFTQSGAAFLRLSVADNERRFDKSSGQFEDTGNRTWFNVTVWGSLAEALAEAGALVKGTSVTVTGELRPREYEKDGVTRTAFDVRAETVGYRAKTGSLARPSQPVDAWGTGADTSTPPF